MLPAGWLTGTGPAFWTPLPRKEGGEVTWLPTQRLIQTGKLIGGWALADRHLRADQRSLA